MSNESKPAFACRKKDSGTVTSEQHREGKMRVETLKAVERGRGKHWTWLKSICSKDIRKNVWRENICRNIRIHENKCV